MKKRPKLAFTLRMDDEVHIEVEKAAKKDRRSMNSWLQIAAEERLEKSRDKGGRAS